MMYILTHEEFAALVSKTKYEKEVEKVEKLNKKILELTQFPCVHDNNGGFGYCDFCPLSGLGTCSFTKHYSK